MIKLKVLHANTCYRSPLQNWLWHVLLHIKSVFLQETLQHKFNFKSITSMKYSCDPYWNRHKFKLIVLASVLWPGDGIETYYECVVSPRRHFQDHQDCGFLILPSQRLLWLYKYHVIQEAEISTEILKWMSQIAINKNVCKEGYEGGNGDTGGRSVSEKGRRLRACFFLKQFKKQTVCRKCWQKKRQSP